MKTRAHGPSLYFATDKNIFDALTHRKVDVATIRTLFEERNIVVSPKTPREELASYFARLNHDFDDHQRIAARLGVVPRRERITSMEVVGIEEADALQAAVTKLKNDREALGDVVHVSRDGKDLTVLIQYTTVDYSRTEFSQVQTRDGTIEFVSGPEGYTVRSTQNDYVCEARDALLSAIEKDTATALTKTVVSLFDIPDAKFRSRFFVSLMDENPDFQRIDVLAVYVYKLELTRFRRHLSVSSRGVYDVQEDDPVHPGVQAADGGLVAQRSHCSVVVQGVWTDGLVDIPVG